MALVFDALVAQIAQTDAVAKAAIVALQNIGSSPADQAKIDAAAASLKATTDALAAALPPTGS